jgi:signal transduction histidine kinase
LPVPDDDLEIRWGSWLLQRNRRGFKSALWIALALFPLFGILDYLIAPRAWLWLLWGTRAFFMLVTLAMFLVVDTKLFDRQPDAITAPYMILASFTISSMTIFVGGLASPYYAGLSLVIVATGLLYVWPVRVVVVTHATIILAFVVSNSVLNPSLDLLTAISNQFFLVSTAIIVGTGQTLAYRFHREQIGSRLIIERTKKNLETAHFQLKKLDRFKSEFFANITHELKTPLTMMLAPLELMVDEELGSISEAQRSTLLSIEKSGVRLLRLIGDLLDLSKLEDSHLRLRVDEHDIVAHLRGLIGQAQPLAQRKAIDLRVLSEIAALELVYDFERMERVFVNLLSNATKFTSAGGVVSVTLHDEGSAVRIDVADNGCGFPPEMASRIFDRFFQVDMASSRRFGGAGIGLALAKELVELHGGSIWAVGELGKGATFSVRLLKGREHFAADALDRRGAPMERPDGQRASDHGLADWRANDHDRFRLMEIDHATDQRIVERDRDEERRPHSVLVVEDTPDVIRVIRLALHHDFRIFAASDGAKGLELAKRHRPTVIVTDLMMPELDGLELTRSLRADPVTRDIPIVMLTARADLDDRVTGLDTGVNAYLQKPFSAKELLSTVRSQLVTREAAADALLAQKIDSLQTIAGGLAHQIRNPLNYVKGGLASLERDTEKLVGFAGGNAVENGELSQIAERMHKLFRAAETGVRRIGSTVDLMVRYSREGYTRTPQPYDVYAAVKDVIAVLLPSADFAVECSTDFDGEGVIECVPEEFNQVLTNLLENALHAVPDDGSGKIEVSGANRGQDLILTIRDNGVGIAFDDQARIFTPFFTTKDVGRGMGLGLTITRRVITALGGSIQVQSQSGAGAQFALVVPRRARTKLAVDRGALAVEQMP